MHEVPQSTLKSRRPATFQSLSVRNYRYFWYGTLASYFAAQMQVPTQAWLTFQLTHSPLLLGLVSVAQGVPQFVCNSFSGVIIDRMQKRDIIQISQAAIILNNLIIAILITTGNIQYWNLLVAAFINGVINSFNLPARNSISPELVPRDMVYNAIALNNGAFNTARIAGPSLAGFCIGFLGTQGSYYVSIGFNIIAITTLFFISSSSKTGLVTNQSFIANLREGFRYLRINRIILIILGMELALTIFGMSYSVLIPVFAGVLKASPQAYGFMMASIGLGALIGSMSVASLPDFKRKGLLLIASGIFFGIILIIFGNNGTIGQWFNLGSNVIYLACFCLVLVGFSSASYTTTSLTIIQVYISDEYRGRITSIYQMITAICQLSYSLSGGLAQGLGISMAFTILGSCLAIFMINMGLFNRCIRSVE